MNLIKTYLKTIGRIDSLYLLELLFDGEKLYVFTLELPENLSKEQSVTVGIKPTDVAISNDFHIKTSFDNQIKASVIGIEEGELVSLIKCAVGGTIIESIISSKALYRMDIQTGDSVVMLLNGNDIFLVD